MTAISELRLQRLREVSRRVGVGKSTIYRWIEQGRFPRPVRIGPNASAWDARLIDRWIETRLRETDDAATRAK